jgi:glycosyltransferase involved in cell wall biosynthesis
LNVVHAIHDFLPRHQAGSEIYAFELCRELSARHHVWVLCADFDPARRHGEVTWRVHEGLPVVEIVNNWVCRSFEETYRSPRIGEQLDHVLDALQPDVLHVHNLLNLSFDLPARARTRGVSVVATLHDYTLVCASGGQRIHRAERHVCDVIEPDRCARCFRESPFFGQIGFSSVAGDGLTRSGARRLGVALQTMWPRLASRVATAAANAAAPGITPADISARLAAARRVFEDVDLFVAPSPSMAQEFERIGVPASKLRISDYGFSVAGDANPTRRARQPHQPLRIGYVGTLVWHKGVHVLLQAIRALPPTQYEVKIFGDLATFPDYVAELRKLSSGLPVEFKGRFDRQRRAAIYDQLDVLVVPSLWLENSPLVIHEAFMSGVPVVGARTGGIDGLVTDGTNGLLYEPTSAAALGAALQRLVDHPEMLAAFSRQLPEVKTIAQDAREWDALYTEVRENRRSRQPT